MQGTVRKRLPKHWRPDNVGRHGNNSLAEKTLECARTLARFRAGGFLDRLFARRLLRSVSHANLHALHFPARVAGAVCIRGFGPLERRWATLARGFDWIARRIARGSSVRCVPPTVCVRKGMGHRIGRAADEALQSFPAL